MNFSFKTGLRLALVLGFLSSPCWAYYDVLDTGEILPKGTYKLMGDTQLLTESGGLNIGAAIDAGIQDQYGVRALVGFGATDYFLGGMFKWIPVPDVEGQPAVGMNIGLLYGHQNATSELTVRWEPLISKKFTVDGQILTPYASLPVGIKMRNSQNNGSGTDISWQLALGTQVQVEKWRNLQFIGEVGLEFSHAPSYITLGAIWYFDEEHGFELK